MLRNLVSKQLLVLWFWLCWGYGTTDGGMYDGWLMFSNRSIKTVAVPTYSSKQSITREISSRH